MPLFSRITILPIILLLVQTEYGDEFVGCLLRTEVQDGFAGQEVVTNAHVLAHEFTVTQVKTNCVSFSLKYSHECYAPELRLNAIEYLYALSTNHTNAMPS